MGENNIIIWQKWLDPFGQDDLPMEDVYNENDQDDDPEYYSEDEEDEGHPLTDFPEFQTAASKRLVLPIRVLSTPMGFIPMNDNTASSKIFNFWTGHTNFNITKKVAQLLEETVGVETLDIFTRYRFRIAIGKAFKDSDIMRDINSRIYGVLD